MHQGERGTLSSRGCLVVASVAAPNCPSQEQRLKRYKAPVLSEHLGEASIAKRERRLGLLSQGSCGLHGAGLTVQS